MRKNPADPKVSADQGKEVLQMQRRSSLQSVGTSRADLIVQSMQEPTEQQVDLASQRLQPIEPHWEPAAGQSCKTAPEEEWKQSKAQSDCEKPSH